MKNVFVLEDSIELIGRIRKLSATSVRQWGKMDPASMLAHCNVPYEMLYEDKHPKAGPVKKFFLRLFLKPLLVGEKPFKRGSPTSPEFIMKGEKDMEAERARLIAFIEKTQALGKSHFHNKESNSLGPLTDIEWNNMMYKHLDHHLRQFSV